MSMQDVIMMVSQYVVGWPLMLYVLGISIIYTIALKGIQFRYFFTAITVIFKPSSVSSPSTHTMTPLQAFINTLNANLGNGSIAGMGTALYAGGPGAAVWMVIFGLLLMAVRFAEVYASSVCDYGQEKPTTLLGGPMLYLQSLPAGNIFAYVYAFLCFLFGLTGANAVQANSISLSLLTTCAIPVEVTALLLLIFTAYVMYGGAKRVIAFSDAIVPIKVGVFIVATTFLLIYHAAALPAALLLMIKSAYSPIAIKGGLLGFSVTQAIRFGMMRSIFATESGLGTAAILFGAGKPSAAFSSGLMAMLSTLISTLVSFLVALSIVVSGAWELGYTSTALTIAAYGTAFGSLAGFIVAFLSVSFGLGVIITYAYIVRETWLFVTNGRYAAALPILYSISSVLGALMNVNVVWALVDSINGGMLCINLLGLMWLLPRIVVSLQRHQH